MDKKAIAKKILNTENLLEENKASKKLSEQQLTALDLLSTGIPQKDIINLLGIHDKTFKSWLTNKDFLLKLSELNSEFKSAVNAKLHQQSKEITEKLYENIVKILDVEDKINVSKLRIYLSEYREYRKLLKLDFNEATSIEGGSSKNSLSNALQKIDSPDKMQIINQILTLGNSIPDIED